MDGYEFIAISKAIRIFFKDHLELIQVIRTVQLFFFVIIYFFWTRLYGSILMGTNEEKKIL